jgi:predicted HTH transcriptional regulator
MVALHKLKKMIASGESETLDFKQTISDASKIAKTLAAFSNHKGGTLLIGVRDNGSLAGVRSEDEKYMLELAGTFYCEPKINVEVIEHEIDGKLIIEAIVPMGNHKPYFAKDQDGKWWVYHRVNDRSLQASAVMFQVLKKQNRHATNLLEYSLLETKILNLLKNHEPIVLNDLVNNLKIQRHRIIHSLAKLIYFKIVNTNYDQKTERYALLHDSLMT